jgi:hypothetical protein
LEVVVDIEREGEGGVQILSGIQISLRQGVSVWLASRFSPSRKASSSPVGGSSASESLDGCECIVVGGGCDESKKHVTPSSVFCKYHSA